MPLRAKCALIGLAVLLAGSSYAQVFQVQGGTSTLINAEGGSVQFKAPNYDGTVGLGFYNGKFQLGAETRYLYHGYTLLAGDDSVPFTLPTDLFDASHYFSARGAGITRTRPGESFYAFAGATSSMLGAGFFNAASIDNPVAIFFYQRKLSEHLTYVSRNIFSNQQTILNGVEYAPKKWLKASLTGGVGSNQKYFAGGIDAETQKLAFKANYVITGDRFERVTVSSPMSSEVDKGNVQVLYKPNDFVSLTAGHENILEPLTIGGPMQQASVNQMSTDFRIGRFYFGTGFFASTAEGRSTQGTNFYGGRRIGQRFEINSNWFESKPKGGQTTRILSGTFRENLSSRLSVLQLVSRTDGQTTFAFGGDITGNRLMLRADYQNVYLPFRPAHPFEQALAFNASFRVSGPWQVIASSNVAPDGRVRYSVGISTYLYRNRGMTSAQSDSFSIARYMVRGTVKDDEGNPLEGAALHIGKEIVYSDSSGHFMARFSKHGPFVVSVALDEFLTNNLYDVVSAPAEVKAEKDDEAPDTEILVRRRNLPQQAKKL